MNFHAFVPPERAARAVAEALPGGTRRARAAMLLRPALLLLSALLVGCGDGIPNAVTATRKQTGKLQVSVKWPAYQPSLPASDADSASKQAGAGASRVIPDNTTRIVISVQDPTFANGMQTFTVTRDNPNYTFVLPIGPSMVTVQEFDRDSPVTKVAQMPITIDPVVPASIPITPESNITGFDVQATPATINSMGTTLVTATAYTGSGTNKSVVPVWDGAFTFTSDDPNVRIAQITSILHNTATLHGVSSGSVVVTAHLALNQGGPEFSAPGQPFQTTIAVTPIISISPTPVTMGVSTSTVPSTMNFRANGSDTNVRNVVFMVVDSNGNSISTGGSINQISPFTATYTAPSTPGTYYIRAANSSQGLAFADATVTVQAGDARVHVN